LEKTFIFAPSNKTSNMKSALLSRFFIGSALLAFPIFGHAQDSSKSKWTITPRVGMTLSTITNGNSNIEAYESRIGFGGGVEAEFHFNRMLGLSFGAFYTIQGAKVNAEMIMATDALSADGIRSADDIGFKHTAIGKNAHFNISDYTNDYNYIERIHNIKDALGYVNIPLMLNVHLPFNLPVGITAKAGAQMDVLVSAKAKKRQPDILRWNLHQQELQPRHQTRNKGLWPYHSRRAGSELQEHRVRRPLSVERHRHQRHRRQQPTSKQESQLYIPPNARL
jgi:hypothetical protein